MKLTWLPWLLRKLAIASAWSRALVLFVKYPVWRVVQRACAVNQIRAYVAASVRAGHLQDPGSC